MGYILSIDQGTTGTTASLVDDKSFKFIAKVNKEFPQIFPKPGMVEHNLNDIWQTVQETTQSLLLQNNITPKQISCIGITNQRETTCAFDKQGNPLANAIVWQDTRTSKQCINLEANATLKAKIHQKTGLPINPYFSATKMNWLLQNNQNVSDAVTSKNLCLGTIDTFLLFKLTSGSSFYTEASNASRTLLMNLKDCSWDNDLLNQFGININFLPEIKNSFEDFGKTKGLDFLPDGIPITGILGDQQAALFGQGGYKQGDIKCTYGTGAFMLLNTGSTIDYSKSGLLTTVAFKHKKDIVYALEGSCYIAGAAVQWLRDNLKIIKDSPEIEELAQKVKNLHEMENILFLPFFTGIGSPYWNSEAKGALLGLTRDSDSYHIARACLEGIALSIHTLVNTMEKDTGIKSSSIKVDGGATANNLLMQMQSTISNLEVIRPKVIETTAYGAALAAAIGSNLLKIDQVESLWEKEASFLPQTSDQTYYKEKTKKWINTLEKLYL